MKSLQQPYYIEAREREKNHLNLNGEWDFCYCDKGIENPTKLKFEYSDILPSATYFNVYHAGILPHPYEKNNSRQYRFVDQKVWYYRRKFSLKGYESLGKAFLCFEGMGYFSKIWINGELLGEHEGLLGGPIAEVNSMLNFGGENELIVEIKSCNYGISDEEWQSINGSAENKFLVPWNMVKDGYASNGDFTVMGIYRDIRLEIVPDIHISRPYLVTEKIEDGKALLHLSAEIATADIDELAVPMNDIAGTAYVYGYADGINAAPTDTDVDIKVELFDKQTGECVFSETYIKNLYDYSKIGIKEKYHECQFFEKDIIVENPKLWYPSGLGEPNLYKASITLYKNGEELDFHTFDFGIRKYKLEKTAGERMRTRWGNYQSVINGKRFFLKGINWMPYDALLNASKEDYRWALDLIKNQNVQMIRVWGAGNAPEDNEFYRLCDEYGILVWQDSFIANGDFPNWDLVTFQNQQCMYLYRLRNHPSLVIHCSGNENNPYSIKNRLVWIWEREIQDLDRDKERIRATPDKGSAHIYGGFEPSWYRKMYTAIPFVGEAGTHSFPNAKTFRKVLSDEEYNKQITSFGEEKMWQEHKELVNHISENNAWGMQKKIPALSHFCDIKNTNVPELCEVSGISSYEYYQFMVQSLREQYPVTAGVMPWVFKRPWTTVAVQTVDGLGDPIAPYYAVKNAYSDIEIHLSLREITYAVGDRVSLDTRIINESGNSCKLTAKLTVLDPSLSAVFKKETKVEIKEDCYQTVIKAEDFVIPQYFEDAFFFIRVALYDGNRLVSQSFYWPLVLSAMKDPKFKASRRADKETVVTLADGPWLKPQLEVCKKAELDLSLLEIKWENDRIFGTIAVSNRSDIPAFPVHICFEDEDYVQCLDDDWFFLPAKESRELKFTLRNDKKLNTPLKVSVTSWNSEALKTVMG